MVPSIAIIDANVLEAAGLKYILNDIVPKVTVSTFKSVADLQQAMQAGEQFVHFFASTQAVVEDSAFFQAHARQTIVLTAQSANGNKLLGHFRCPSSPNGSWGARRCVAAPREPPRARNYRPRY